MLRGRRGQLVTGARISKQGINYRLAWVVTAPKLPLITSFLSCNLPASVAYHPFPPPVCSTYNYLARVTQIKILDSILARVKQIS